MTRQLRGAVIGCGFFAQNHLNGWADIEGVEIVAVCDRDAAKAEAMRQRFGIRNAYDSAEAMFAAETLDFVDIPTTMETHEALVGLAIAHGVPTIVQKPFAPDLAACRRMVAAAAAAGVPLMVHENFRFQHVSRAVKRIIDSGEIGDLTYCRLSWRTGYDIYAGQPYLALVERFVIMDVGIHILDLARFLFGDAGSVFCRTQQIKPGIVGEDSATMLLQHDNGALSVLDVSYGSKRGDDVFPLTLVDIEGTKGMIEVRGDRSIVVSGPGFSRTEAVPHDVRTWTSEPWTLIQDSVVEAQRHFVECLRSGAEPETSGRDSLLTYGLMEAAYQSAKSGQLVIPDRE